MQSRAVPRALRIHRPRTDLAEDEAGAARGRLRHPATIMFLSVLLATLCGFALHPRAFVAAVALTAIFLAGMILPWLSLRLVSVEFVAPRRRTKVGEAIALRALVRNPWPWPVFGVVLRGGWSLHRKDDPVSLSVARAPALQTTEIEWNVTPPHRGLFPVAPARMECGFPFGLITAVRRAGMMREVVVWPASTRLPRLRILGRDEGASEWTDERRSGNSGEVTGARIYRPGESLRRVHWPQTAKHGHLIVCERSAMAGRGLQIVVETAPDVHTVADGQESLEVALSVVASAASSCAEQGCEVSIVFDREHMYRAENRAAIIPLLDALALFNPAEGASLDELFEAPDCRDFDGALQLVVTTREGFDRIEPERRRGFARRWLLIGPRGARRPLRDHASYLPLDGQWAESLTRVWQELERE